MSAKHLLLGTQAQGVIDATKVLRVALENAVSTAGVLLLAEGTMTEIRSKKDEEKAPLPE